MDIAEPLVENDETDHDLLENAFGLGYYVLMRIKTTKMTLEPLQKMELMELIHERDHFAIWRFVKELRKL